MPDGQFRLQYPRDTTALYRDQVVEVLLISGSSAGPRIEDADLQSAEALIRLPNGDPLRIPFNEITVPAHPTAAYYGVFVEHVEPQGSNSTRDQVIAAAGRTPQYEWGTAWGTEPWTKHYQWSETDQAAAQALADRIQAQLPAVAVRVTERAFSFAPPPTK